MERQKWVMKAGETGLTVDGASVIKYQNDSKYRLFDILLPCEARCKNMGKTGLGLAVIVTLGC